MMATTHGYAGLVVAAGVATGWPEFGVPAAVGGIVGGLAPDLDVVGTHRRTFHFPVIGSVLALLAVCAAAVWPSALTVGVALGILAAALHALSDVLGGSAHPRPWANSSDRAVYAHATGQWIRAREWVRYDGSPADFLLGLVLAMPSAVVFRAEPIVLGAIVAGLVASGIYTAFRKPIGRHVERLQREFGTD